jgi:Ca-activated chloride channel family protein
MWGQIGGENKIVIARRVLGELAAGLPDDASVGLVAYGHRREGDCDDIETVLPLGRLDRAALQRTVDGLNPKGKTPLTAALRHAFEALGAARDGATVVLVSDGLETCGGDPCAAVRTAREAGAKLLLHVVAFDVAGEDVSQLECAAQAGGGLYFDAENADELSAALDQAVAAAEEIPDGRLSVKAIADGELTDVAVHVIDAASGDEVAGGRTYTSADTNPRFIPLADGRYDVKVTAVGMKGDIRRHFEGVEIKDGSKVEKVVDFSTGELAVGVTRNGALSDATVRVYVAGSRDEVAAGRTYTGAKTNPASFRITAGDYDVEIGSVEISSKPEHRFAGVTVDPGGRAERAHEFVSGTLKVGAAQGGELVDATARVVDLATGKPVGQARTYTDAKTNPKTFELPPGTYKVTLKAVRLDGGPMRELEVTVVAGETVERMAEFGE